MPEHIRLSGHLRKMETTLSNPVAYRLPLDGDSLAISDYLGEHLRLGFGGIIHCIACGRLTKKSFQQGYCFPCTRKLAECDICIVRPERCHYAAGTCREPEWGLRHCMQPHFVYLANSSGLKVGITRATQIPTRWMDQGATQALPVFRVQSRYQSGLLEVALAAHVADKTDWRRMLRGATADIDLAAERDRLLEQCQTEIAAVRQQVGAENVTVLEDEAVVDLDYPVLRYPEKIKSLNLDKTPTIEGRLEGIKGQYLLFDTGVINIRKYAGYQVSVEV